MMPVLSPLSRLKRTLFPKGVRRAWRDGWCRACQRVSCEALLRHLRALGVAQGDLLCVHSSLSRVGYLTEGVDAVVQALQEAVGPSGTLMMPTFTGGASTYEYVCRGGAPFDPDLTPCTTGRLPEAFRTSPGTVRSCHPTHSVAARGPLASEIVEGHERSLTPFGPGTPYEKLVGLKGKILLINTNANSLLHRVQEVVDWPNHYLDRLFELPVVGRGGRFTVKSRVHAPGPFSYVVLPATRDSGFVLLHIPAYALPVFLGPTTRAAYEALHPHTRETLEARFAWFLDEGIVRVGRFGFGQAVLIDAARFVRRLAADFSEHLASNRHLYDPNLLRSLETRQRKTRAPGGSVGMQAVQRPDAPGA